MLEETLESLNGRFKIDCFFGGRVLEGFQCLKLSKLIEHCPESCVRYEKVRGYSYRRRNGT